MWNFESVTLCQYLQDNSGNFKFWHRERSSWFDILHQSDHPLLSLLCFLSYSFSLQVFSFFYFVCWGRGCVLWWLILLTWTRAKCTSMKEPSSLSTSIYRDDRVRNIWYGVGWQYHALKLYYSTSLTVSLYR